MVFCSVRNIDEIKEQDWMLSPGRYVGVADSKQDDSLFEEKMTSLVSELKLLFDQSNELGEKIQNGLKEIGFE